MKKTKMSNETQNNETAGTNVVTATVSDAVETTTESAATIENGNEEKKSPGRPVVEGSARQQRLVEQEMRKLLNGGDLKRGRPINKDSNRQQKLAKKDPNAKPGRPAYTAEQKAAADQAKKDREAATKAKIAEIAKAKLAEINAAAPEATDAQA